MHTRASGLATPMENIPMLRLALIAGLLTFSLRGSAASKWKAGSGSVWDAAVSTGRASGHPATDGSERAIPPQCLPEHFDGISRSRLDIGKTIASATFAYRVRKPRPCGASPLITQSPRLSHQDGRPAKTSLRLSQVHQIQIPASRRILSSSAARILWRTHRLPKLTT